MTFSEDGQLFSNSMLHAEIMYDHKIFHMSYLHPEAWTECVLAWQATLEAARGIKNTPSIGWLGNFSTPPSSGCEIAAKFSPT